MSPETEYHGLGYVPEVNSMDVSVPEDTGPNTPLGFEVSPPTKDWSFAPEFYPTEFTQMKERELSRYGGARGGESVSIKSIKNREFHASGMMLFEDMQQFQALLDYSSAVDLISPLTTTGGMECMVKKGEIGSEQGWDPQSEQRIFKYKLDLVSTGRDEYSTGDNAIVTGIIGYQPKTSDSESSYAGAR